MNLRERGGMAAPIRPTPGDSGKCWTAVRNRLLATDLEAAGMVDAKYQVTGIGPMMDGRNGGGDLYCTDGEVWILRLVPACQKREGPPIVMPSPPATEIK